MTTIPTPFPSNQGAPEASQPAAQIVASEEAEWRKKEERLKELTYDQERKEHDSSIQLEEKELTDLRAYPISKLAQAGIIGPEKAQELQGLGITNLERLIEWTNQQV